MSEIGAPSSINRSANARRVRSHGNSESVVMGARGNLSVAAERLLEKVNCQESFRNRSVHPDVSPSERPLPFTRGFIEGQRLY